MRHDSELEAFIQENRSLFWGIRPEERANISVPALVEAVLNYGNEKSVKKLFDIIGIRAAADSFYRQVSGRRSNYHQRTENFFRLYFKRHAQ